jgi:hypothetical protein
VSNFPKKHVDQLTKSKKRLEKRTQKVSKVSEKLLPKKTFSKKKNEVSFKAFVLSREIWQKLFLCFSFFQRKKTLCFDLLLF